MTSLSTLIAELDAIRVKLENALPHFAGDEGNAEGWTEEALEDLKVTIAALKARQ